MVVVAFAIFYIVCMALELQQKPKAIHEFLIASCLVLAVMAGLRGLNWPDTEVYVGVFASSPNLFDYDFGDVPVGYQEKGFYLIGTIVKLFTSNATIYLLIISLLTFFFLEKGLRELSVYPLIGLCTYMARFMLGRNYMQIRAGLAYAIIMIAIIYIYRKDWKRYFLLVFIAYTLHRSSAIAIPLYFFCNWFKIDRKWILIILGASFLVGFFGQGVVHGYVEDNATDLDVVKYTEQGGEKDEFVSLGMANPMIYYQVLLLLLYTFFEKRIAIQDRYYYVIRTAYLYSTAFLICFCSYKVISARTSTLFATLEFSIVPSLIYMFNKRNRKIAFVLVGLALTAIFYMYQNQGS